MGDRTGIPLDITIRIVNVNDNCNVLEGVLVDIWHCDKDGNYSEYGGTAMQSADYTSYHFLRGRQVTDANGEVHFTSIFPGWYTSRATHIHVHVYSSSGSSLLVTQISFPEGSGSAVELVNAASQYGYTKGMSGYTYNAQDNVFSDDTNDTEMCSVSGNIDDGYVLTHEIGVSGETAGLEDWSSPYGSVSVLYPNPMERTGNLDVSLKSDAQLTVRLFDLNGKLIAEPFSDVVSSGAQSIQFDRGAIGAGIYIYRIVIDTEGGVYEKAGKLMVK